MKRVLIWLLMLCCISLAWAADGEAGQGAAPHRMGPGKCRDNPDQCRELRSRWRAWCEANPQRCEAIKQRRAERRATCAQNPQQCRAEREARRQKRAAACTGSEKCPANAQGKAGAKPAADDEDDDE